MIDLTALIPGMSGEALLFLVGTAFIAGLARGFSGFGAALIFMPLASAVIEPARAAPLLLLVDAIMALGLIPNAWRRAERRNVGTMALGALIGVPLGTAGLALLDPLVVRWAVVVIVTLLLGLLVSGWRYRGRPYATLNAVIGIISGFFTGAAQVGGPPVVAYWLGGAIGRDVVRANIVLYFAISSAISIVSYLIGGLLPLQVLILTALIAPAYGLGLYLGARMFGRASDALFRWICYGLIAIAAIISLPLLDPLLRG
jgi:uncharacterized membrane protein YfcA